VEGVYGGRAGSTSMDAYSLGGYWTHRADAGWYVDSVLQGTWYRGIEAKSVAGEKLRSDGRGLTASVEAGYPFALGNGWTLEPQAQLIYQSVTLDDTADSYGKVSYDSTQLAYGRLGARVSRTWDTAGDRKVTGWGRANLWHAFGSDANTTVSALDGSNPVSFNTNLGGTWAQVGVGVSGQVAKNVSLFAAADYNRVVAGGQGDSFGGRVGVVIAW
ncbi:autotransporter domain-containing protein, partial [Uliginosibacterium sp. sgz301328]|uniref:autotransporter domain-containing protein n=1 Tax=Uliginosibacterium sp. sgz301328 TaxID=3243764 RepID=UPI00359D71B8